MDDINEEEKAAIRSLARALWRVENREDLPTDPEARKEAYLTVRSDYVKKATQVMNQLKREGVNMSCTVDAQ